MKIGEVVKVQGPKMPKGVELVEDLKDFRDFVVYCDVMNYHPISRPHSHEGVADLILTHQMYGIFDAHTNKGYIIDGRQIGSLSAQQNYLKTQLNRCRSKYINLSVNTLMDDSIKTQFLKWNEEVTAYES